MTKFYIKQNGWATTTTAVEGVAEWFVSVEVGAKKFAKEWSGNDAEVARTKLPSSYDSCS